MDERLQRAGIGGTIVVIGAVLGLVAPWTPASVITVGFVSSLIGAMFLVAASGPDPMAGPGERHMGSRPDNRGDGFSIPHSEALLHVLIGAGVVSTLGLVLILATA